MTSGKPSSSKTPRRDRHRTGIPPAEPASLERMLSLLKDLDQRVSAIELNLGLQQPAHRSLETSSSEEASMEESGDALETRVGENWFAKVGIIILALGVVFLLTFPYQHFPSYAPSLLGYVLVAGILLLSRFLQKEYGQVSSYLLGGGLLLLYFTTLRLSHFGAEPALTNAPLELVLLLCVVALNFAISVRRQSPFLTGLSFALSFLTALAGDAALSAPIVITATTLVVVYVNATYRWPWILTLGIVLTYLTHLLWSFNNPVFGNPVHLAVPSVLGILCVLVYAAVFAVGSLAERPAPEENLRSSTHAVLNGFGSFVLTVFLAFAIFKSSFAWWSLAASLLYLSLATAYWMRLKSRYATFIYAMLGYAALSAAIADLSVSPDVFVWLCWQSVLVLSTAVWFRSRFIVVANFFIFLSIFVIYLVLAGTVGIISVSFGIVALVSARILNWQKDRLELRTELMRNSYLACALFVLPYALYHVMPSGYVSLSWLCLALFYYLTSRLLHNNRKYRWMALLTTILTICYVFTFELVGINPALRIVSFLVLGTALLGVSMIYSRRRRKR